jgi:transcriptional regulator GlxA family with amidase domain
MESVALLSSNFKVVPSVTVDDCPDLDILVIGGTMPETFKGFSPKFLEFIKRHNAAGRTIFTTCTGAAHLASTGVLDGRNATVNNCEFNWIAKQYPKVKWSKEKKWVVDGNVWTGSGVSAGMDMVAHWIIEQWGLDVMMAAAKNFDFEPRDIDGLYTVFPKRYNEKGEQISTNDFS